MIKEGEKETVISHIIYHSDRYSNKESHSWKIRRNLSSVVDVRAQLFALFTIFFKTFFAVKYLYYILVFNLRILTSDPEPARPEMTGVKLHGRILLNTTL